MRRAITAFLMLLAASLFALPASAAERVALIIGNSKYDHAPYLPNPANDAHDVAPAFAPARRAACLWRRSAPRGL